jgi:hypothetical protein
MFLKPCLVALYVCMDRINFPSTSINRGINYVSEIPIGSCTDILVLLYTITKITLYEDYMRVNNKVQISSATEKNHRSNSTDVEEHLTNKVAV